MIFPSIVDEGTYVRFAVRSAQGTWLYGQLPARDVDPSTAQLQGFRFLDAFIPYGISGTDKSTITQVIGDTEYPIKVDSVEVLSPDDQILPDSCAPPAQSASTGDVICIPSEKPLASIESAYLITPKTSLLLTPLAFSKHASYFLFPELPSGDYIITYSNKRFPITITHTPTLEEMAFMRGLDPYRDSIDYDPENSIYHCDCIRKASIVKSIQPNLTGPEIERLQTIVKQSLAASESDINLARETIAQSSRTLFDIRPLLAFAIKIQISLEADFRREKTLAAFADYVENEFSIALDNFPSSTEQNAAMNVATASLGEMCQETVTKEKSITFLNALRAIIQELRVANEQPLVSISIQTSPAGGAFVMHPFSADMPEYRTPTPGTISGIWIGIYKVSVSRRDLVHRTILNLVDDRSPILKCNLLNIGKEQEICGRQKQP